ncbi:transcriptional regulator [Nonomuraea sp. B12E4]|uniref:transcriptional regulator n=1 Tax=Nonomuraea sp. B12E4 TaxID=3153564 RepID=UPI00325DD429
MHPHDAQSALDNIRRLRSKTIDEYLRQSFAFSSALPALLMIFAQLASFDVPWPYAISVRMVAMGVALLAWWVIWSRTPVQRSFTSTDFGIVLGWAASLLVAFVAFRIITWMLDLPVPATIAAAATVVVGIVIISWSSRTYGRLLRRQPQAPPTNPSFNEFLNVPIRQSIMAILTTPAVTWVEVGFLKDATKTDDVWLRQELSVLAQAAHVVMREGLALGGRRTYVQVMLQGRRSFESHTAALEHIAAVTRATP